MKPTLAELTETIEVLKNGVVNLNKTKSSAELCQAVPSQAEHLLLSNAERAYPSALDSALGRFEIPPVPSLEV